VTVALEPWSPGAALLGQAAVLLLVAGASKAASPGRTVGALRELGWPSSPALVRAGAAAEVVLGASALVVGGAVTVALVAASYLGFAVFTARAMRSGTPVGSCGCFGQADTPPRLHHVLIDVGLAAGALVSIAAGDSSVLDNPAALVPSVVVAAAAYQAMTARHGGAPARRGAPHRQV
jgi:hypothetical protein